MFTIKNPYKIYSGNIIHAGFFLIHKIVQKNITYKYNNIDNHQIFHFYFFLLLIVFFSLLSQVSLSFRHMNEHTCNTHTRSFNKSSPGPVALAVINTVILFPSSTHYVSCIQNCVLNFLVDTIETFLFMYIT